MRILIVTTDFLPNVSGIATLSYEQAKGLADLGHDISVATATKGAAEWSQHMAASFQVREHLTNLPPIIRLLSLTNFLTTRVKEWKPDYIWCPNYRGFGLPVMKVAKSYGIPYGMYLHGTELITESTNRLRHTILKNVLSSAAVTCVNSHNTAVLLKKMYGYQAVPVNPGVHPRKEAHVLINQAKKIRASWLKQKPSVCSDENRIIFIAVCRISRQKGIDFVLESLAMLEPTLRQRALFVAVGSGEAASELKQLAERLLINDNVIFAGPAGREDVPTLLKAADVYIQPSQPVGDFLESFGISFLEAQAAGLPCVGTNWGGVPEAVQGPATALLVPTGSIQAITEAISKAIADEQWRAGAQKAGPIWASKNSWSAHVNAIAELLPALPAPAPSAGAKG